MKQKKDPILDNYTIEELAKILDEECRALNIPCIKNGQATEFEPLKTPVISDIPYDSVENYTIETTASNPHRQQPYSRLKKRNRNSFPAWVSTEIETTNCTSTALQLAA